MVFSSLVFLSLFLPSLVLLYFIAPRRFRNILLLAASIFFYAWGDAAFLWVLAVSVLCNYIGALVVSMHCVSSRRVLKGFAFAFFLVTDFSLLFHYKYSYFFFSNISTALGMDYVGQELVLPLGISFYTFQGVSYLVDVYRGVAAAERSLPRFALYISFFPQLVAKRLVQWCCLGSPSYSRRLYQRPCQPSPYHHFPLERRQDLHHQQGHRQDDFQS